MVKGKITVKFTKDKDDKRRLGPSKALKNRRHLIGQAEPPNVNHCTSKNGNLNTELRESATFTL